MNNCQGCGVELQTTNKNEIGYKTESSPLCERCFRIRNYGEYKKVTKNNQDFINILKNINKTKDLVILVIDIFNLIENMSVITENITNKILLVITKRDIIPKKISDNKIINYIKKYKLNVVDSIVISSNKNYNFDNLYDKIIKHKTSKQAYVIGYTNAGKSTMINKIIYNYSQNDFEITTSILPSTTLNNINIKINDNLTLIDTPGIIINDSFFNILEGKELKKIFPKKEIKPISYQVKGKQYIEIDKYAILELENINIVIFMSNTLQIKRFYKPIQTNLKPHHQKVDNCDIVINGLGFIKCIGKGNITIYTYDQVKIFTREHLI